VTPTPPIDWRSASQRVLKMRRGRILFLVVAPLLLALVAYATCSVYIHPNQLGIKQVTVGPGRA
jgi:hypothetical protein